MGQFSVEKPAAPGSALSGNQHSDFPQSGYNVHRLSRDVTQLLLHKASLAWREIEEAAEWMVGTIRRFGNAK